MNQNRILLEIEVLRKYNKENNSLLLNKTSKEKQTEKFIVRSRVTEICSDIENLNNQINSILIDSSNHFFEIESFFENQKNKIKFSELNPRVKFQQEWESERLIEKEKLRQKEERKRQLIENINANKKELVKSMYLYGPEDTNKLERLIEKGFDVSDSIIPLSRMIEKGRTKEFIQFLIEKGLNLTHRDIIVLKEKGFLNNVEFLNVINTAKQIDNNLVNQLLK